MGSVFGKQTVAEPAFESLLNRTSVHTTYEIRKYGQRFAAEVNFYDDDDDDDDENEDMSSPFRALAGYIGVFGSPENEGSESIRMTAPVVIEGSGAGTPIAMTAPVVISTTSNTREEDGNNMHVDTEQKVMKFILPAEYDDIAKIPKPTNPAVHIESIPPSVGAVHRYAGKMSEEHNRQMAIELADQLIKDGLSTISEEDALEHFQFWGYNPPFTIPMFRRNEVWMELTEGQVDHLLNEFAPTVSN